MATGVVSSVTPAAWDPSFDLASSVELVKRAFDGDLAAARRVDPYGADFVVQVRQEDSAEAGLLAIDLTARGVTFPAGSVRTIDVEAYCTGNTAATETLYTRFRNAIVGGTTPVLGIVIGAIDTNVAGAVGGFTTTDPSVQFALSTNNVTLTVTNEGAAEINNWIIKVRVGKLQPVILGV